MGNVLSKSIKIIPLLGVAGITIFCFIKGYIVIGILCCFCFFSLYIFDPIMWVVWFIACAWLLLKGEWIAATLLIIFLLWTIFREEEPFEDEMVLTADVSGSNSSASMNQEERADLVGKHGIVITPLRPSGKIKLGDNRFDVVSEGEFIGEKETVEIIRVEGQRIIVAKSRK